MAFINNETRRRGGCGGPAAKRLKLAIYPNDVPMAQHSFVKDPLLIDLEMDWKFSEFVPSTDPVHHTSNHLHYLSPKVEANGLQWYIEVAASNTNIVICKLMAENTLSENVTTSVWISGVSVWSNPQEVKKVPGFVRKVIRPWQEDPIWIWRMEDYKIQCPLLELMGHVKISVHFLYPHDAKREGLFTKLSRQIQEKMIEDAKGNQFFNTWIHQDDGPDYDFWIQGNGFKVGFHKCILRNFGGDFIKIALSTDLEESRTGIMKMEKIHEEIIQGFKSYLYYGTIPKLAIKPVEYFEFGSLYQLPKLKELAELECCKQLDIDKLGEVSRVANLHETSYLKDELLQTLYENPNSMKKIISKNFAKLDFTDEIGDGGIEA